MAFSQPWWNVPSQIWFLDLPGTCGPEENKIMNGAFRDNSGFWVLGANWVYESCHVKHTAGSVQPIYQVGTLLDGSYNKVNLTVGGTIGTVLVALDGGDSHSFNAGAGDVSFFGTYTAAANKKLIITPSTDFNGTISNVQVRKLANECE